MPIRKFAINLTLFITIATNAYAIDDWQPLPTGTIQRIAFGSCAMQFKPQPIWEIIAELEPDLFLFVGDNIYADYDGHTLFTPTTETLKRDWNKLATNPYFKNFRQQVPVMATWDNHDYGKHNGGARFDLKELTKAAFLDFFGEAKDSTRRKSPGIYAANIFGPEGKRVQVILLDTRYFRGPFIEDKRSKEERKAAGLKGSMGNYLPNNDPDVSMLGEAQWTWLEQQLSKPVELRLIVSSIQVIPNEKAMDEWGNYPLERQRLLDLIKNSKTNGVILLSGNVHFTEISQLKNNSFSLVEFTSSGLTHFSKHYAAAKNKYRIAGPYAGVNFGLIEIDWATLPAPKVSLISIDEIGTTVFEYNVSLQGVNQ